MIEFLTTISKFWPLLVGMVSFIFALGVLWQRTQAAINGVTKLFTIVDEITGFKKIQEVHNEHIKEQAKIVAETLSTHDKEDSKKFQELMVRVDQIFNILSSRQ